MRAQVHSIDQLNVSPTLAANERVQRMRSEGREICHMGFGQAPFPAPLKLVNSLCDFANEKNYLPVMGLPELREEIALHQAKHAGIDPIAFEVAVGPGSKSIIFALQMAIDGDLLLPNPSWVSYAPQAKLIKSKVIPVPAHTSDLGLIIDPYELDKTITNANKAGLNPSKLLINFPSNPTGLTIKSDNLQAIIEVCEKRNIVIISDEIYGRLSYDHIYRSAAKFNSKRVIVTTGLSKHMSLGGWRLGVTLIPKEMKKLISDFEHIASELWSCVAAPIQYASVEAYSCSADMDSFVRKTTNIHKVINTYISKSLGNLGVTCATPQGGFYNWPDFSDVLNNHITTSDTLSKILLEEFGIVSLPGTAFGTDASELKLRLSGCDYDGEHALNFYNTNGEALEFEDIETIAPNVTFAMRQFSKLMQKYGK